jgi:uncharacterized protein YaaN involved in tellurite resistance
MTDETPTAPAAEQTEAPAQALVLTPPAAVPAVSTQQAAATTKIDDPTARQIDQAVNAFVESLVSLDTHSPDFQRKVDSVSQMGNQEIRRSAEVSNRFLDRPAAAMDRGPLGQGSKVSTSLVQLRRQVEELDPTKQGMLGQHRLLGVIPFGNRMRDYFNKYQSAQHNIDAIIQALYHGQEELQRDNAAIEQEKVNLWNMKGRLEQYAYMAAKLDEALEARIRTLELGDPEKAKMLQEDVLFYVRQKRQDVLTQLAVNMQGYLALDLIRKNNLELVKGVERATTTTVSALRTAVIAALAMGNQKLVLDQVTALNTTTGNIIESTSEMLRQQTLEIASQAANATVSIEKLQAAFNNIYATIDTIDTFKLAALDSMRKTIESLSGEVARAQQYVERARSAELAQTRANGLVSELTLPARDQGA